MCQSGATCLPVDCCFSELALLKIQLSVSGLEQNGPHHHLVENKLVLAMNNNHSLTHLYILGVRK
jgi:hypothetical protein